MLFPFTCLFNEHPFYLQISNAEFSCPSWFSAGAKRLIRRILNPNPTMVSVSITSFDDKSTRGPVKSIKAKFI